MAKTSKTTKRTSSASKKGVFKKLNLSSPRTRFLAVILIIAVAGAGWFTYRSFAATSLVLAHCEWSCRYINDSQNAKNEGRVAEVKPGGKAQGASGSGSLTINPGQKYRACASVKTLTHTRFTIYSGRVDSANSQQTIILGKSDGYKEFCTMWVTSKAEVSSKPTPYLHSHDGLMRVAYIVLQTEDPVKK